MPAGHLQPHGGAARLHAVPRRLHLPRLRAHRPGHLPAGLRLHDARAGGAERAVPRRLLLQQRHHDERPLPQRHDAAALPVQAGHLLQPGHGLRQGAALDAGLRADVHGGLLLRGREPEPRRQRLVPRGLRVPAGHGRARADAQGPVRRAGGHARAEQLLPGLLRAHDPDRAVLPVPAGHELRERPPGRGAAVPAGPLPQHRGKRGHHLHGLPAGDLVQAVGAARRDGVRALRAGPRVPARRHALPVRHERLPDAVRADAGRRDVVQLPDLPEGLRAPRQSAARQRHLLGLRAGHAAHRHKRAQLPQGLLPRHARRLHLDDADGRLVHWLRLFARPDELDLAGRPTRGRDRRGRARAAGLQPRPQPVLHQRAARRLRHLPAPQGLPRPALRAHRRLQAPRVRQRHVLWQVSVPIQHAHARGSAASAANRRRLAAIPVPAPASLPPPSHPAPAHPQATTTWAAARSRSTARRPTT